MEQKIYLDRYRVFLEGNGAAGGASAATFKAEDTQIPREVLVQTIPVAGLRLAVREKIEAEALAAKQISHLNIPVLYDFGFTGDQFVYVTEYFDGTSAQDWVAKHGPLPLGAVLRIASQMVGALGAAAFHGILHHAINPANVILVPGQTTAGDWPLIKIRNFLGVAPAISPADFESPANFASPEQLAHGAVDFRSEIYSLGGTLWFLLTGAAPSVGASTIEQASGIPESVKHLLGPMLAADANDRPLDPLALQEQIQRCIAQVERRDAVASKFGMAPAAVAPVVEVIPRSPRRPIPWRPLAVAALLLAAAALAVLVLPSALGLSHLFARGRSPIGVPVGIPEPPPPAVAAPSSSPAELVSNAAPAPDDDNRPVLVSTASADDPIEPERDSADFAANDVPEDSLVPAADSAPDESQPTVASNVQATEPRENEPPSPAEGPEEVAATPPVALAANTEAVSEQSSEVISPASATSSTNLPPEPEAAPTVASTPIPKSVKATAATTAKRASKTSRSTAGTETMPPLPPPGARAHYIGTTPDGELVFGVPSAERVYVAPPATRTQSQPRRRARRIVRDPISELPILPALPPDE